MLSPLPSGESCGAWPARSDLIAEALTDLAHAEGQLPAGGALNIEEVGEDALRGLGAEIEELWGVASRTNFDLTAHQNTSGKDLTYFDQESNEHYVPFVIEPSLGVERMLLAFLCNAYDEEVVEVGEDALRGLGAEIDGILGLLSDALEGLEHDERFRADKIIEDWAEENSVALPKPVDAFSQDEMKDFIEEYRACRKIPAPSARTPGCGR